jgi:hypothetical protein
VAGGAVGALTSPVTGPIGPAVGAAIGSSLGTRAANMLPEGFRPPPETPLIEGETANLYPSDVLGALPVVPAIARSLARKVAPTLPGASRVMHEMGEESLEQLPTRLGPAVPSDDLFAQAATQNPAVVPVSVRRTADDLLRRERALPASVQQKDIIRVADDMLQLSQAPGAVIPLHDLDNIRKRVGLLVRQANAENWPQASGLKAIYSSMLDDMTTAAQQGVPGADTLLAAIKAHRQERGLEGLTDLWSQGKGIQLEGDITRVYGKRIQNQFEKRLHDDKLFAGSFDPEELVDIRETLKEVATLTSRAPASTSGWVGEGIKWIGRLAGVTEAARGGNVPLAVAITVTAEMAPMVIASAMQSRIGRWALREALAESKGILTPAALNGMASVVMREEGRDLLAPADSSPPPVPSGGSTR